MNIDVILQHISICHIDHCYVVQTVRRLGYGAAGRLLLLLGCDTSLGDCSFLPVLYWYLCWWRAIKTLDILPIWVCHPIEQTRAMLFYHPLYQHVSVLCRCGGFLGRLSTKMNPLTSLTIMCHRCVIIPYNSTHGMASLLNNLCIFFTRSALFWVSMWSTPNASCFFGSRTRFHATCGGFFALMFALLHKQCLLYLSISLITDLGILSVHMHVVCWEGWKYCVNHFQSADLKQKVGCRC